MKKECVFKVEEKNVSENSAPSPSQRKLSPLAEGFLVFFLITISLTFFITLSLVVDLGVFAVPFSLLGYLIGLLIVLYFTRHFDSMGFKSSFKYLGVKRKHALRYAGFGIAFCSVQFYVKTVIESFFGIKPVPFSWIDWAAIFFILFIMIFVVGFFEEITFRGYIQSKLVEANPNKVFRDIPIGLFIATLLFGLAHIPSLVISVLVEEGPSEVLSTVFLIILIYQSTILAIVGLTLGMMFYRSNNNLFGNMTWHGTWNLYVFINPLPVIIAHPATSLIIVPTLENTDFALLVVTELLLIPLILLIGYVFIELMPLPENEKIQHFHKKELKVNI